MADPEKKIIPLEEVPILTDEKVFSLTSGKMGGGSRSLTMRPSLFLISHRLR
jgi:hypothetical protein